MNKYYMLVENISNPILIELKILNHSEKYFTFNKNPFKKLLPKKLFKKLIKKGLYENPKVGEIKEDRRTCLHRLVTCLYQNILGLEVHHIKKLPQINFIDALIPVKADYHKKLDAMSIEEGLKASMNLQNEWKKKIFKQNRSSLAKNENIIKDVMSLLKIGKSPRQIEKIIKKIKSSKIYEYKNFFYYWDDFIEWLENESKSEFSEIDGNYQERWKHISNFEKFNSHKNAK